MTVPHVDVETALGGGRVRAEVARVEESARVRGVQVRLQQCAIRVGRSGAVAVEAGILVGVPPLVVVVLPL